MRLDEFLHIGLDLSKTRHDLDHAARRHVRAEQLQAQHLPLLGWKSINAEKAKIVSGRGFENVKTVCKTLLSARPGALAPPDSEGNGLGTHQGDQLAVATTHD
ncbi:hypothetical protein [Streptomyces sp. GZWMJZ-114]|uniref:hypothetical protein n=1 Tax=Streptomyces sp. GZWMJZ-114 TaxID=2494734 RepID=UPI0013E93EF8|nr:hypothetical protein [Streptomyces sp. GZWMJZ-114]